MQRNDYPATRDLVLVGGGHTHALVLRQWGMSPLPGVRLTLIDPNPVAPYTGMLPGLVAGHYQPGDLQIDLVQLARFAGARLVLGRAVAIDRTAQRVTVPGRPDVAYDLLSLDVGITSDMPGLPGFAEWAVAAKPLAKFSAAWEGFAQQAGNGAAVAVLGGGVAGVELALAMAERLRKRGVSARITVIETAAQAMAAVGAPTRAALLGALADRGIVLALSARAVRVERGAVWLENGQRIAADFVVGAAGALAQGWLGQTGLALHAGFVTVGPTLQSPGDPAVFAVGDCAHISHAPRPKAGVFAVRQAPVLLHNLRAALTGGPMRRYWPQRDYLKLISTGGKQAVADKFGLRVGGSALWWLKNRIDQRFMAKFHQLPPPEPVALPQMSAHGMRDMLLEKPLCGGCGAKVGRQDLMAALAGLPHPARADVVSGPGDDAAILRHGAGYQVMTTDHLRAVTDDPVLMVRIAAIHALGDIWAMGATPQVALAQIILPRMSSALQARSLHEINRAAADVFGAEGVDVVGGHTSLGAELTIGFTVTGLCARLPLTKGGARAGDALVLTKPIGSGVILAAEMARRAPGPVVAGAWASMVRSQRAAAAILADAARAMTDVTGFGLAGHLGEMLAASGVGALVNLNAVPLLPGALALAQAGIRSSLYAANRGAVPVAGSTAGASADLLFDPQTGGGLLAAVPPDHLAAVLAALNAAGTPAAVIGHLRAGAPMPEVYDGPRDGLRQ